MEDAKTDSVNLAVNLGEGAVAHQLTSAPFNGHHIWCNFSMGPTPAPECHQCKGLFERYPMDCPPDELAAKHFPDAIPRGPTN